jgi:HSP20 family molecular chaperone IbpA
MHQSSGNTLKPTQSVALEIINKQKTALLPKPYYYITPEVEILATVSEILLIIDLPGVPDEWLSIVLDHDQLLIEGVIQIPAKLDNAGNHYVGFKRLFKIDDSINRQQISAIFKDGELRIHLPRKDSGKPIQIRIR